MAKRPKPIPAEHPRLTPDRTQDTAVRDSFPASDPPAPTVAQGVRATPPEQMLPDENAPAPRHAVRLTREFTDAETAKLALESLIREIPLQRSSADIDGAVLVLRVAPKDCARVEALLERTGGGAPAAAR